MLKHENIRMAMRKDEFDGVKDIVKRADIRIYLDKCFYNGSVNMHTKK